MSISFNLSALDVNIIMSSSGELLKIPEETITADANAEFYIRTSDIRGVFMFQSDSDDIDTITNSTDIKYFIRQAQWPSNLILNPCHAWVSSGQIATTDRLGTIEDYKELVKHDFVRYIAKSLFGTHLAVDLFNNEDELKYDLAYKGYYTAWNNIWNSLSSISDLSLNTTSYANLYGLDASYGYYLTNDCSTNINITRQLLNQVILNKPERLQNLNTYVVDASKGFYLIPLVDGDSILFKLTLNPAPNQHKLLNKTLPIPSRSYKIRINLVSNVTNDYRANTNINVIPNDLKPLYYNGSSNLLDLNNTFPSNYSRVRFMRTSTGTLWFDYIPKINLYLYSVLNSNGTVAYTPNVSEITRIVKNVKMSSELTSYMNKGLLVSVVGNPTSSNNLHTHVGRLFNNTINPSVVSIINSFPVSFTDVNSTSDKQNLLFRFSFIFRPVETADNKFVIQMGARTGVYGIYIINVENMDVIQYMITTSNWATTLNMGGRDRSLTFTYIPNNRYLVFMFIGSSTFVDSNNNAVNGINDMRFRWRYNISGTSSQDFSQFDYPIFNYNF